MSERMKAEGMRRLVSRMNRLHELLESRAPEAIVAEECTLIGEVAWMLDPAGQAARNGSRMTDSLRRSLGICTEPGCDKDATYSSEMCAEHEDPFVARFPPTNAFH